MEQHHWCTEQKWDW